MEKRMILAIVLSIVILLVYTRLFGPEPVQAPAPGPPQEAAKAEAVDNAAGVAAPPKGAPRTSPGSGGLAAARENPLRWITVRTPLYQATLSTAGGGMQSFSLNRYNDHPGPKGKPLEIIGSGAVRPLPLDLYLAESQPAFPEQPVFASNAPDELSVGAGEKKTVTLSWESAGGVRILREYTFTGDRYDFEVAQKVTNSSRESLRFRPGMELSQIFEGELGGDS